MGSAAVIGFLYSMWATDCDGYRSDKLKNRPDMKPYAAMVKPDEDDISRKTMYEGLYVKHMKVDRTTKSWFRWMFPSDANFAVKDNPYRSAHHKEIFNRKDPVYSTYTSEA